MLFLGGCMLESVPPMNYYTLNYYPVDGRKKTEHKSCLKADKVLKISPISALSPYNSQAIVYSETPNNLNSYVYSQWRDAPVRLLEKLFQQSIQARGIFKAVVTDSSVSKADYLLESNLLHFYQMISDQQNSYVLVTIQFVLLDARQRKIIATTTVSETAAVRQNNAQGAVNAFNQASRKVADKLIQGLWNC
jgi:ABC-type uncharacterized transport system auxiliary subunit